MQTIAEQLHKAVDQLEVEINQHEFCTLIFKIQNGRFIGFEKTLKIRSDEIENN